MREGDVAVAPLALADGRVKNRPVVVLREMPPIRDVLVCGISTQLYQQVRGFDEVIATTDADFAESGLITTSLIRLGYLSVLPRSSIPGSIGAISRARHRRLLTNLSDYLLRDVETTES